ncbi:MAG: ABC transporter permease, partial [archaeon]|nr:ABC transporter permease [archaeon]
MIKLSFSNLFRRKTRTFLSVAGIAIGVAAILVLVSIVDGFTIQFDELIGDFKAITVVEKDSQDQTLSRVDESFEQKLGSISGVKVVVPEIWLLPEKIDGTAAAFGGFDSVSIYGLDPDKYFSGGSGGYIGDVEKGST